MKEKQYKILTISISVILDLIAIYLAFYFAYWIRFFSGFIPITKGVPPVLPYQRAFPLVAFSWLLIFKYQKFYQKNDTSLFDEFYKILKGTFWGTIFILAITFFYREFSYSRIVVILGWFFSIIFIFLDKLILRGVERLFFKFVQPKKILVSGEYQIVEKIKKNLPINSKIEIVYLSQVDPKKIEELFKTQQFSELIIQKEKIDSDIILFLSSLCDRWEVDLKLLPELIEMRLGEIVIDPILKIPVLRLRGIPITGFNLFLKRFFDITFSILAISFLSPLWIIISCLIKIDSPGPVLYKQIRLGYKNEKFNFYKFRTMKEGAEKMLPQLWKFSERKGGVFKMKNDPRVTKVGRFLRRYSLDEIPQFLNVLKGEMSLVGPRPQILEEAKNYDLYALKRLKILPGVTGLWQISGRSDLSYQEMINLDIYYVERWSLETDFKIILKTIPAVLSRKGAY